jgi:hypothetical protein
MGKNGSEMYFDNISVRKNSFDVLKPYFATPTGLLKGYLLFNFYNYATSTKLKIHPRRGYIIVE